MSSASFTWASPEIARVPPAGGGSITLQQPPPLPQLPQQQPPQRRQESPPALPQRHQPQQSSPAPSPLLPRSSPTVPRQLVNYNTVSRDHKEDQRGWTQAQSRAMVARGDIMEEMADQRSPNQLASELPSCKAWGLTAPTSYAKACLSAGGGSQGQGDHERVWRNEGRGQV